MGVLSNRNIAVHINKVESDISTAQQLEYLILFSLSNRIVIV